MQIIDQQLNSMQPNQYIYQWLNILIFNVTSFNEEYIKDISQGMLQSTSQNQNYPYTISKEDRDSLAFLREGMRTLLAVFCKRKCVTRIIEYYKSNKRVTSEALSLLETIEFLCAKYEIHTQEINWVKAIIDDSYERLSQDQEQVEEIADRLNPILFGNENKLSKEAVVLLTENYNLSFSNLVRIVGANYFAQAPSPRLFRGVRASGKRTIQLVVEQLVKKSPKQDLFGDKSSSSRLFVFLMEFIMYRFGNVYLQFTTNIMLRLMVLPMTKAGQVSPEQRKVIGDLCLFLSHFLKVEYPNLQHVLYYTYLEVAHRYHKEDGMQIMKKLLLNRFLLNPSYYALYFQISDEQRLSHYIQAANKLRILFYDKKLQELGPSTQAVNLARQLKFSLKSLLQHPKPTPLLKVNIKDKGVYLNDKVVKHCYEGLHNDLSGRMNSPEKLHFQSSDPSLSFSFLKNESASRRIMDNLSSVRKMASQNPKFKQKDLTLHQFVDQLKSEARISAGSEPHKSSYSQQIQEPTEHQILSQLLQERRYYGSSKRNQLLRCQQHRRRRQALVRAVQRAAEGFQRHRTQIESDSNHFQINLQLI